MIFFVESYSILSANIEGSEEDVSFHTSIKKSVGKFDTESKISSKVNDQYACKYLYEYEINLKCYFTVGSGLFNFLFFILEQREPYGVSIPLWT